MKINVPQISSVDMLLVGGSLKGVLLALAAKQHGHTVLCVTPAPYFAEERTSHFDLQGHGDVSWKTVFLEDKLLTPMDVKRRVEQLFMDNDIDFVYQINPICPVYDDGGNMAGLIVADRSGFQAIQAKVIVDATENSLVARCCGLPMTPFKAGLHVVTRFQLNAANGANVEKLPLEYSLEGKSVSVYKITEEIDIKNDTVAELARAEVEARLRTWHPDMTYGSDVSVIDGLPKVVDDYKPSCHLPLYLVDRVNDVELLKALAVQPFRKLAVTDRKACGAASELVRKDTFHRFHDCPTVSFDLDTFAVDETVEVLVVGGGTGGAPAAIAAGRAGAKTMCIESLNDLGGVMTVGRITVYYFGNRVGFTTEIDKGIIAMAGENKHDMKRGLSDVEAKKVYFLREVHAAGVDMRFGTMAVAASIDGKAVDGVLTVGPYGIRRIAAKRLIDATGNADVVAAAGGETVMASKDEPSIQGAGLSPIRPGYVWNTDFQFICDHDILDCTRSFVMGRAKFRKQFDVIQIQNTRERRRIVGDIVLQPSDFYANRKYDDTVVQAMSNFDTHGFIVYPMFMLQPPTHDGHFANVPFRALLPKDLENIAATGLAVSAQRDCLPLIRMQPDVQNQGYAVGYAAAMAAREGKTYRTIDKRKVQKHLVEKQILPESILEETDDIPGVPATDPHYELATIFMSPAEKLPELQTAYDKDPSDVKTAMILAFLGEKRVKETIVKALKAAKWDEGWNYRGMGQFGMSVSHVDCMLFALTAIGGDAVAVRQKLADLYSDDAFSHFRAVSYALQKNPDPDAADLLEEMLRTPGMSGYAIKTLKDAGRANRREVDETTYRNSQLKEFYLAKALAACRPGDALAGGILNDYRHGLMGYFSLYA
ncbi:MAG: FAD-dependent oxidoreductase [Victivallales bacterium]|nr:FAD-dependent oxidoreductase [Victivallales bacterium]